MCQPENIRDAFPFIKKILASAFRTDVLYFAPPYQDIRKIDWGFRDMVWENVDFTPSFADSIASSDRLRMLVVRAIWIFIISSPLSPWGKNLILSLWGRFGTKNSFPPTAARRRGIM